MEERINAYEKVSSPEELLSFMDEYIKYGILGTDGKIYRDWADDQDSKFQIACQTKYALCDKARILNCGLGTCWDQVELERAWFKEHGYQIKTFFIWFHLDYRNNYCTHTYLVYEKDDKYYYFEHSDYKNEGIHEFDSYEDAIKYQMSKHIEFHKARGLDVSDDILSHLEVMEYDIKEYGINKDEYLDNIFNSKIVYQNNEFMEAYKNARKN